MFWTFFLAHLIGDYPLQTSWMVQAKRTWWGLTLHVMVHLVVLLVLVGPARRELWLYLLALAAIHFGIDTLKNLINKYRPQWVVGPYIFDQLLHLLSFPLIVAWIERTRPAITLPVARPWLLYAIGYLLATYVWYITERILSHKDEAYKREMAAQLWPRMAARALLVTIFLLNWPLLLGISALAATTAPIPYITGNYGRRALLTDIVVALVIMIFLKMTG
jgi:hypothetical protein